MKVQYFGDEHDFRKYALLRKISEIGKFKIGICWMLTPDDDRNDGGKREYLRGGDWLEKAPEVFRLLRSKLFDEKNDQLIKPKRDHLKMVKQLVPNAIDFEKEVSSEKQARREFHDRKLQEFKNTHLIFYDPDNGIEVKSCPLGRKNSIKYVYLNELAEDYRSGKSIITYQHFPFIPRNKFVPDIIDRISNFLGCGNVKAFETPYVLFIAAIQPEHEPQFNNVCDWLSQQWPKEKNFVWVSERMPK